MAVATNKDIRMLLKDPRSGKFVEREDSFSPKSISFRLSKESDREFRQRCEEMGISPGQLCRQIIEEWLVRDAQ